MHAIDSEPILAIRSLSFCLRRQLVAGLAVDRARLDGFASDAHLPVGPGRPAVGRTTGDTDEPVHVEVFDIDLPLVEQWREVVVPMVFDGGYDDVQVAIDTIGDEVVAAANDGRSGTLRRAQQSDLVVERPGVRSTAFDPANQVRVGLHIDTHGGIGLADRQRAPVLCSVNLGTASRFLHVLPVSVEQMLERLGAVEDIEQWTARDLKNRFLASHPDIQLARLELAPGQGYVCNTQNLLHDGATNSEGVVDISSLTLCHQP